MERVEHTLAEARQERQNLQDRWPVGAPVRQMRVPKGYAAAAKPVRFTPVKAIAIALAALIAATLIGLAAWTVGASDTRRSISLGAVQISAMGNADADLEATRSAIGALKEDAALLEARVDFLMNSTARLEEKLIAMAQQINAIDVAATSVTARGVKPHQDGQQSTAVAEPVYERADTQGSASSGQAADGTEAGGPWVVNLASFPDQLTAERFMASAESQHIALERRQAMVNGKRYWRVQLSGFPSVDEAKSQARSVKAKLGLPDVWISKR